jgi:RNA polymerase sigma-70 factor (ECF subfamily)
MKTPDTMTSSALGSGNGGSTLHSTLLQKVQADEPEAWQRLVRLYGPVVFQWCRRAEVQPSDANDILQEVFRAVMRRIKDFRRAQPGDSFRGWLWTITRRKIIDHARSTADDPLVWGGTDANMRLQQIPEDLPEASRVEDYSGLARRAMELLQASFEERTWKAFWGVVVDGRRAGDIAAELGMSTGAVREAKRRVLCRLRRELEGLG